MHVSVNVVGRGLISRQLRTCAMSRSGLFTRGVIWRRYQSICNDVEASFLGKDKEIFQKKSGVKYVLCWLQYAERQVQRLRCDVFCSRGLDPGVTALGGAVATGWLEGWPWLALRRCPGAPLKFR